MTTAPTPQPEALRLAAWLNEGAWHQMRLGDVEAAGRELKRLHAENERLRGDYALRGAQIQRMAALIDELEGKVGRFQGIPLSLIEAINAATGSNEWQGDHSPAELLDPACRAIAELEARKPLPVSDEQIDAIADGMPGGLGGFMKTWGWRQFARKILDLRAPPTWEPGFDFMVPGQEELAIQFCAEIAGPRGQPGRNPDPVRLLEMAEALYKAEADAIRVMKDKP